MGRGGLISRPGSSPRRDRGGAEGAEGDLAMTERDRLNEITGKIIGAAIAVHRVLGPGLLESAYEACLADELVRRGLAVERQCSCPVVFAGRRIGRAYRIDLRVERLVPVEVKAVAYVPAVQQSKLLSYMKLTDCRVGLLINFHVRRLVDGVQRLVNGFPGEILSGVPGRVSPCDTPPGDSQR